MWWTSVLKFAQTLKLPACSRDSLGSILPKRPGMCWPRAVSVAISMELFGCCKARHRSRHKGWEQPVSPAFLSLPLLFTHRQHDGEGGINLIWMQMGGEREKMKKEKLKRGFVETKHSPAVKAYLWTCLVWTHIFCHVRVCLTAKPNKNKQIRPKEGGGV